MCTQWVWIWILVTHALQFIIYLASKFVFETISTWYFRDISLWERRCCRDVSLTITNPILQINLLALLKYLPGCFGDEIKIIIHLILSWAWKSQHAPISWTWTCTRSYVSIWSIVIQCGRFVKIQLESVIDVLLVL